MEIFLVSKVQLNPYVRLMADGLRQADPAAQVKLWSMLSPRRLLLPSPTEAERPGGKGAIYHLHWAEVFCQGPTGLHTLRRTLLFLMALRGIRLRQGRIVYTMHNLDPHDPGTSPLVIAAMRSLWRDADALHFHEPVAQVEFMRRTGRAAGLYVAPHGHYIGAYPDTVNREQARRHLGIDPQAFVYLFLGQIRPYKGLETLVQAFRQHRDEHARLVIAGHVAHPAYAGELATLAREDRRIIFRIGYVADESVQFFLRSADVAVFPYREVTTSGAAILALSFGVPILVPAIGSFPELAVAGRGMVYEPNGLLNALAEARRLATPEARQAALQYARTLDWVTIAHQHLAAYQRIAESE